MKENESVWARFPLFIPLLKRERNEIERKREKEKERDHLRETETEAVARNG